MKKEDIRIGDKLILKKHKYNNSTSSSSLFGDDDKAFTVTDVNLTVVCGLYPSGETICILFRDECCMKNLIREFDQLELFKVNE